MRYNEMERALCKGKSFVYCTVFFFSPGHKQPGATRKLLSNMQKNGACSHVMEIKLNSNYRNREFFFFRKRNNYNASFVLCWTVFRSFEYEINEHFESAEEYKKKENQEFGQTCLPWQRQQGQTTRGCYPSCPQPCMPLSEKSSSLTTFVAVVVVFF